MEYLPLSFFYLFAFLAVAAAAFMLYTRNVLYAAFGLLLTLLSMAAIFVLLFADFIAITQLMVYVGGVLVLILFGVMLSNRVQDRAVQSETTNRFSGSLLAAVIFSGLAYLIYTMPAVRTVTLAPGEGMKTSITAIGIQLITNFVLPFEATSLILLIALIGAAFISTPDDRHD